MSENKLQCGVYANQGTCHQSNSISLLCFCVLDNYGALWHRDISQIYQAVIHTKYSPTYQQTFIEHNKVALKHGSLPAFTDSQIWNIFIFLSFNNTDAAKQCHTVLQVLARGFQHAVISFSDIMHGVCEQGLFTIAAQGAAHWMLDRFL